MKKTLLVFIATIISITSYSQGFPEIHFESKTIDVIDSCGKGVTKLTFDEEVRVTLIGSYTCEENGSSYMLVSMNGEDKLLSFTGKSQFSTSNKYLKAYIKRLKKVGMYKDFQEASRQYVKESL